MNFGSYWFSDKIVLRMYQRAGGRVRATALHDGRAAGAAGAACRCRRSTSFRIRRRTRSRPAAIRSTPRSPRPRASSRCSASNELEGVIAHELAHVKNRDILISSVAATMAAAIMMPRRWRMYAAMFGGYGGRDDDRERGTNPIALLAMIILAPLAAMLIQMAISRSREFAADAGGAQIAGNPYGLADALRKIEAVVASACRSTPTRPRRTCSSSSRSAGAGLMATLQQPSADRRAHPRAARRHPVGRASSTVGDSGRPGQSARSVAVYARAVTSSRSRFASTT